MDQWRDREPPPTTSKDVLDASVLSDDPAQNLQLGLGVELAVIPPYLYALWSIRPPAEGASTAASEAANSIRAVAYEEMLHASLVGNILNALGVWPKITAHLMTYPGPLPGHTSEPPYAYDVSLAPLSTSTVATFVRIERPEWEAQELSGDWITIADLYAKIRAQLEELGPGAFRGEHQLPLGDNPGPGRMLAVVDLPSARQAIETIVDQGEGHRPKSADDLKAEEDDDHEVAHYYQFKAIGDYFATGLIDPDRDLYPVIENPKSAAYTPAQQSANSRFNEAYTALLDSLQATFSSEAPRVFGRPTQLMAQLPHLAAVLRRTGIVPGTQSVAGPTFEYLGSASAGSA